MSDNIRVFKKDNQGINGNYGGGDHEFEIMYIKESDITNEAYFSDCGIMWAVRKEEMKNLQAYEDVGDTSQDEGWLENHIVFNSDDVPSWFHEILKNKSSDETFESALEWHNKNNEYYDDREIITLEQLEEVFAKILDLDTADQWADTNEIYTYWDGSNHKSITLSGDNSEWIDVTSDEEYQEVEELDRNKGGHGLTKLIKTKTGDIYQVYSSFYVGDMSETWTKTDKEEL